MIKRILCFLFGHQYEMESMITEKEIVYFGRKKCVVCGSILNKEEEM